MGTGLNVAIVDFFDISRRAGVDALGNLRVDASTRTEVRTKLGLLFSSSSNVEGAASLASLDLLFVTGSKTSSVLIYTAASAESRLQIYEGVTTSNDGTPGMSVNQNRVSEIVAESTIFTGPTISDLGSSLENTLIPGGNAGLAQGDQFSEPAEWIFRSATKYLIRLTNINGAGQDLSIRTRFYEG